MNPEQLPEQTRAIGAVMVVGGGIGGIQAALDLAESGFKVYLVDKDISIGGVMAQLDKTFPTNDCSTCMISPKLIEVAGHPDIEIVTRATVEAIAGEPGAFTVMVKLSPRFVNPDLCTACGECTRVCPVAVPADFNLGLDRRKAIYRHFPQAIPAAFAIDKRGTAPCKSGCPAGISVQGYVALIAEGRYQEALDLIRRDNPLPAVCGRVCPHPCETLCSRGRVDEPIAIKDLKRFVTDWELEHGEPTIPSKKESKNKKVAIIGSGPAGLTAAHYLALEGYQPTVFEAMAELGGWMRYGIPEYRLPRPILDADIDLIRKLGVEFRTGVRIGHDVTFDEIRQEGFEAIYIAIGTQRSTPLMIPGSEGPRIMGGSDFLKALHEGRRPELGQRVAVIGGGDCAMDASRMALRMGARKVFVLYRRTRRQMPATEVEVDEALAEGIEIHYLTAPVEILVDANGNIEGLRCIRMELGTPDDTGRRRPVPVAGSEFTVAVDSILPSIGLETDLSMFAGVAESNRPAVAQWGTIHVDPVSGQTSVPDVFAGGDAVSGPATVVQAIAAGKSAARSIDRFLQGLDLGEAGASAGTQPLAEPPSIDVPPAPRVKMPELAPEERVKSQGECQLGYTEQEALAEARRCLQCGICSECYQCVDACIAHAVDHDMQPEYRELEVGSVLVAPGFRPFDARLKAEYGYGRYPNVITSLEFERILSASGPTEGHVYRPSDGRPPRKVAWIQCIGSRDAGIGQDYCSTVCCMYATKQSIVALEHEPGLEGTIFYIDVRAMGKGFERYYERAKAQYGVRYVCSHISRVIETPSGHDLELQYMDYEGCLQTEVFDLVVLSVGLKPSPEAAELARTLGLESDRFGFFKTPEFDRVATSRPGIFTCGVIENPKDIPETVAQASAATAAAQSLLAPARNTLVQTPELPEERPVAGDIPRIGVFICHCGINIAGVVDVASVSEYARTLPNVVYADHVLFACATDTTTRIKEVIAEHRLNRVVVASCSPRTHEPLFQNCLAEAGLNKFLFEMANIRDQCSWVHSPMPADATEKAKDLVRMAVAKALFLTPLHEVPFRVVQKAIVLGGGAAGMTAALNLAEQGFFTYLVEREPELGGQARRWIHRTPTGGDVQPFVAGLVEQVEGHPAIEVYKQAELTAFSGHMGHFEARVRADDTTHEVLIGALLVATGAEEYRPTEYLYGESERVLTQLEFHRALAEGSPLVAGARDIVMIQCVGSRDEERPYCSRVCCTAAVSNALWCKRQHPDVNITVLYRDIRTFGTRELHYKEAREAGVRFCRFVPESKPEVTATENGLKVAVFDQNLRCDLELAADCLVLSAGIVPRSTNPEVNELIKAQLDPDGFFMEAHVKLRPLDFASPGVFLCGLAHSPKFLDESIVQAKGAAARAALLLSTEQMHVGGSVAVVDPSRCAVCLTCVRTCPFGVPRVVERGGVSHAANIDPALCQGCGMCVAECPAKAIQLQCFTDPQILVKTDAAVC